MIDKDTIYKWWSLFVGDGHIVEVRILGKFQYSGYFKDVDNLIKALEPFAEWDDEQIYFTLNRINEACYGRQQCEKFIKSPKTTTSDNDIVRRQFVMLDFDPKRSSGVNASDAEVELAHKKAQDVFVFLREKGFEEPIICISGNGWHLQYKVDMPNTAEVNDTIKTFLQVLGLLFSDDGVDVDEKVFNSARLCKVYGTMAKKGANLDDRKWRMSKIVHTPNELKITPLEKFQEVASLLPKEEPKVKGSRSLYGEHFDLDGFLNEHNISFKKVGISGGTKYILDHCFFDENHKGKDAVLFQYDSGAISYVCLHQSCKNHTWRDVRLMFDPHAYDHENQPRVQYTQGTPFTYRNNKPKYEIKEELPELGRKWLSMSDIQKIDLSQVESIKTGIDALDKDIVGLNMSEVTLLSGSNSSGKSSWLNTLILNVRQQGYKSALWSGELRADILKAWIQMVAAGKRNLTPSKINIGRYYVQDNIGKRIDAWLDGYFFLFNNEYGTKWEQILHDMRELLKVDVKLFVLDNLFTLDIDLFDGDRNNKQKELIIQIKDFAKKNQVHIVLVAHPRKTISFLRKTDISGTSDLTNAVDDVFIMHRVNQDFLKAGGEFLGQNIINQYASFGNVIEVAKNRMYGIVDRMYGLHYEIESRRFKNTEIEDIHYGWEAPPTQQTITYQQPQNTDTPFDISTYNDMPPF